jgi:hypothetical protein
VSCPRITLTYLGGPPRALAPLAALHPVLNRISLGYSILIEMQKLAEGKAR